MSHFAKLDENNLVLDVNVVSNYVVDNLPFPESEMIGINFLIEWSGGYTNWKQTSYNGSFRKNYAAIGFTYNPTLDAFIAPQPYQSWILNEKTCQWCSPVPYPEDGKMYTWDENEKNWAEVT